MHASTPSLVSPKRFCEFQRGEREGETARHRVLTSAISLAPIWTMPGNGPQPAYPSPTSESPDSYSTLFPPHCSFPPVSAPPTVGFLRHLKFIQPIQGSPEVPARNNLQPRRDKSPEKYSSLLDSRWDHSEGHSIQSFSLFGTEPPLPTWNVLSKVPLGLSSFPAPPLLPSPVLPGLTSQINSLHPTPCLRLGFGGTQSQTLPLALQQFPSRLVRCFIPLLCSADTHEDSALLKSPVRFLPTTVALSLRGILYLLLEKFFLSLSLSLLSHTSGCFICVSSVRNMCLS